jgi:hypothetical protein
MAIDRKALAREYRETPRPVGIFRVRNVATGRTLLGTSVDLPSMLNRQRMQLRLGGHPNRALQADWNAVGEDGFAVEVVDTLAMEPGDARDPADDLRELEALWRERLGAEGASSY